MEANTPNPVAWPHSISLSGAPNTEGAAGFDLLSPLQCPLGPKDVMGPKVVTGERGSQGDAASPAASWSENHGPHYILRKQTFCHECPRREGLAGTR